MDPKDINTMVRDEVIRIAIKCQLVTTNNRDGIYMDALERFADLVRAAEQNKRVATVHHDMKLALANAGTSGRLAEREACARMVDHILKEGGGTYGDAIRARYNTGE